MRDKKLRIGSRGSKLALWQSHHIKELLEKAHPELSVEITIIKTKGDIIQDVALSKIGDKGLFTKELENALLANEVDLCVHSMKDMPTELPYGLVLGPVPKRVCALDALVASKGISGLDDLPHGARIGTGSLRRRAQLYSLERDFELVELRGNLDTRIKKVETGEIDAAILAVAGIQRLGWDERISARLSIRDMTPAVGQGALALEIRESDTKVVELCSVVADHESEVCVKAERYIMNKLEGGCQVPIGAHAWIENNKIIVSAMVAAIDGSEVLRAESEGDVCNFLDIAQEVVDSLLDSGAKRILQQVRNEVEING